MEAGGVLWPSTSAFCSVACAGEQLLGPAEVLLAFWTDSLSPGQLAAALRCLCGSWLLRLLLT
jgi:hypothetical protein